MKRIILLIFICAIGIVCFAQQKSYITKTIGSWKFEKFPSHYYVAPFKVKRENSIYGKLAQYSELDSQGQPNGLLLTICNDGNPCHGTYRYKGKVIYSVSFFPNSNIIERIKNMNEKGNYEGPQINRTWKESGGYNEEIEIYANDVLIERNGVKQAPISAIYLDSLLNGNFKFDQNSAGWVIEGEAEKGKLKKIKQAVDGKYSPREITFMTDSFTVKALDDYLEGKDSYKKYPIVSCPRITNSKSSCLKYGNYNGFPYFYIPDGFEIRQLETILKSYYPEPLETKVNFNENLLDGDFQYRQYIYAGVNFFGEYVDIIGKSEKGKLLSISLTTTKYDMTNNKIESKKKVEYIFQDNKIQQNDYLPLVSNESVSSKTLDLAYPVLLTNSIRLGGTLTFYEYGTENNILNIPYNRWARLEKNEYGYMYFNPLTFDFSYFLKAITTKPAKK